MPGANSPFGPLVNARVGVGNIVRRKFDELPRNFDGLGANVADNDALRLFTCRRSRTSGSGAIATHFVRLTMHQPGGEIGRSIPLHDAGA